MGFGPIEDKEGCYITLAYTGVLMTIWISNQQQHSFSLLLMSYLASSMVMFLAIAAKVRSLVAPDMSTETTAALSQ